MVFLLTGIIFLFRNLNGCSFPGGETPAGTWLPNCITFKAPFPTIPGMYEVTYRVKSLIWSFPDPCQPSDFTIELLPGPFSPIISVALQMTDPIAGKCQAACCSTGMNMPGVFGRLTATKRAHGPITVTFFLRLLMRI